MRYAAAVAILSLLAACGAGPPAPIPPPLTEVMPKPPVSAVPLTWQPGHWDWTGSAYVWAPGEFVDRTGGSGTWIPPSWGRTSSGWVWLPAHWL
jgi:hypothetical protein